MKKQKYVIEAATPYIYLPYIYTVYIRVYVLSYSTALLLHYWAMIDLLRIFESQEAKRHGKGRATNTPRANQTAFDTYSTAHYYTLLHRCNAPFCTGSYRGCLVPCFWRVWGFDS